MENEVIQHAVLGTKLCYFNAFLEALGFVNSYSEIGMQHNLFAYNVSNGDIVKAIQDNSYELFGVYPNEWEVELFPVDNWEVLFMNEVLTNFRRGGYVITEKKGWETHSPIEDIYHRIKFAFEYFVSQFKSQLLDESTTVYEMKVTRGVNYRIVGIDLIFEIGENKVLFLQILGND